MACASPLCVFLVACVLPALRSRTMPPVALQDGPGWPPKGVASGQPDRPVWRELKMHAGAALRDDRPLSHWEPATSPIAAASTSQPCRKKASPAESLPISSFPYEGPKLLVRRVVSNWLPSHRICNQARPTIARSRRRVSENAKAKKPRAGRSDCEPRTQLGDVVSGLTLCVQ
jgi:hypothetical protein